MSVFNYIDSSSYFEKFIKDKNIVCWGVGAKCRQAFSIFKKMQIKPLAVCDGNPVLWGQNINFEGNNYKIENYEDIKKKYTNILFVLTMAINNAIEVKRFLESNGETKIIQFCNPFKVDNVLLDSNFIDINKDKIAKVYEILQDDLSKKIFIENLNYKITGDMLNLYGETKGDSFFEQSILGDCNNEVYIDIGAYTGDTVCKFLQYTRGNYKYIYAFEADEGNFCALKNFIRYGRINKIGIYNCALWSEKSEMTFHTSSDNSVINYDSPNLYRGIDNAIDNSTRQKYVSHGVKYEQKIISTYPLDQIELEYKPTIIKINALAADFEIIKGAKDLIANNKPKLIMEHAVKPENITDIILYIKMLNDDYKFILRQVNIFGDSKTVLYAV